MEEGKKLMTTYRNALQAIYDHVDFVEDWVVCPIDDRTEMYWKIIGNRVEYSPDSAFPEESLYSDEIYAQRFYEKHIYEGKELTLIFVDTHTDGNKFFAIFDNSKNPNPKPE